MTFLIFFLTLIDMSRVFLVKHYGEIQIYHSFIVSLLFCMGMQLFSNCWSAVSIYVKAIGASVEPRLLVPLVMCGVCAF